MNQLLSLSLWRHLAIALTLLSLGGCGNSNRPTTVPVRGMITVDGEPPAYPGALFFAPLEVAEGYPKRGGRALFDTDGAFAATSFDEGDGLVPGTYRVRVESWKRPPSMQDPGERYISDKFESPDLVVAADKRRVELNIDVPQ